MINKLKINRLFTIITFLWVLIIIGCEDQEFLNDQPHDSFTSETYWTSEKSVEEALTQSYINAFNFIPWEEETASDNSYGEFDWYSPQMTIANGTIRSSSDIVENKWSNNYSTIRSTNLILENIENVEFEDKMLKVRFIGEAKFIRAWAYLDLTFNFGNIPLVTEVLDVEESKEVKQSSQNEIYQFIIDELESIENDLPESYDGENEARITKGAVYALKARTFLFQNDYENVLTAVEQLENLNLYHLYTAGDHPYDDLFSGENQRNDEIIFSVHKTIKEGKLSIGHSANMAMMMKGLGGGGDPYFTIYATGSLADAYPMLDGKLIHEKGSTYDPSNPYANRDPRLTYTLFYPGAIMPTLKNNKVLWETTFDPEDQNNPLAATAAYSYEFGARTGLLWRKYLDFSPWGFNNVSDNQNDVLLIRYADVLLMRAEALAEISGGAKKMEIIEIINLLRNRAGGGEVHEENYNSQKELIDLVRNERRIELANEGLRYYDIIRWKIAEKNPVQDGVGLNGDLYGAYMRLDGDSKNSRTVIVDGVPRRYIMTNNFDSSKRYLLPIPQRELDLNENLEQNPGW